MEPSYHEHMYKHVVVGGTFDGLHAGHQAFLRGAFGAGARVIIGLTSERYIRRYKKNKGVAPYSKRYQALTAWLRREGIAERTTVIPLDDRFGPAVLGDGFDAIAVTSDTRQTADEINRARMGRGFAPLAVIDLPLVVAQDTRPISATRVRAGEITGGGRLILPDNLRPELRKPLGTVLTGHDIEKSIVANRDNVTISVGDVATQTLFSFGVQPSLAIIDLQVNRKPYQSFEAYKFPKKYRIVRMKSGPGYIAKLAIKVIKEWSASVKDRTVLVIDGEEDLLAIPAIIHAPIGSMVYYGQPHKGLVEVLVSSEKKKTAVELLQKFV